jgi:SAM-dependent methyltransferase
MTAKADFTDEYNATDPRAYYANLGDLAYQVPAHGAAVFRHLSDVIDERSGPPTVLDVCCSYGINAALLNHDLSFEDLRHHYTSPAVEGLTRHEMVDADRQLYAAHRRPDARRVLGLDVSENAVGYAVEAGLLDGGIVADLESEAVPGEVAAQLGPVDLVTITGGVGYVNEGTFEQIVSACDAPPWIAALSLRWIGFDPIAESLEEHGLVTERLDGYAVRQRRFADAVERDHVLGALEDRGILPNEMEEEGWHCAELYVVRPEGAALEQSVDELLGDAVPHLVGDA